MGSHRSGEWNPRVWGLLPPNLPQWTINSVITVSNLPQWTISSVITVSKDLAVSVLLYLLPGQRTMVTIKTSVLFSCWSMRKKRHV